MKKLLLLLSLSIAVTAWSQVDKTKVMPVKAPQYGNLVETSNSDLESTARTPLLPPVNRDVAIVNPIEIGQAGNAFGFAFHRTTYLWADNNLKSISFIHRMTNPPGTGYLAYDLSKDAGENWETNIQCYDPAVGTDARYPQGVIYNPAGNTNPDDAYFHYFAPSLDATNDIWGGYVWGVDQMVAGSTPTAHYATSGDFWNYLPSGFTITQDGIPWMVDEDNEIGGEEYTDNLILGKGTWTGDDFDYNFEHLELEIHPDAGINDVKIAFAPDGQTGWICALSELPDQLPNTTYHPILMKTEDGGESWSEPIEVQLGGPDGLDAVKQFITDEWLEYHFDPDPVPPRDEIDYFMGYHMDLAVDAWGNPHIIGLVAIADAEAGSWWNYEGVFAMFHIYSLDQGLTWQAHNLKHLKRFDAEFTNSGSTIVQYNRPQVATTMDGAIVFFSWLDTDVDGVDDNSQPDIWFADYQPMLDAHGDAENVTAFSSAMWQSYFGAMSHYVFHEVDGNTYNCTIPFVYEEIPDLDPLAEVQFWYIPDFTKTYTITDVPEFEAKAVASISNIYPNPATNQATIRLNLLQSANVSVEVFSLTGQKIKAMNFGKVDRGISDLNVDVNDMKAGIYFYTVTAGSETITKKLIVE